MNKQGYVLIEVLVASVLLSVAGSSLYMGVMEGIKVDHRIRESNAVDDPLKRFWMRLEKDLRNSVSLCEHLYIGRQEEMSFPVIASKAKPSPLRQIRYFIKGSSLIRSEQELSTALVKKEAVERVIMPGIQKIKFQYAYLDEKEELSFQPFWLEEPYFGIPKAVRVDVELPGAGTFSKFIAIPQGRWGHLRGQSPVKGQVE